MRLNPTVRNNASGGFVFSSTIPPLPGGANRGEFFEAPKKRGRGGASARFLSRGPAESQQPSGIAAPLGKGLRESSGRLVAGSSPAPLINNLASIHGHPKN
jgi:hypothetical protein